MTSRWLLAGMLAIAACTSPRQIVLSIDTTAGVPCDIDRIRVVAEASGTTTFEQSLIGARLPVRVTLLDDTPDGNFRVDISGLKGDVELMRTRGPLQFTGHRSIESVLLEPKCTRDAPCELSEAMADAEAPPAGPPVDCGAHVTRYSASVGLDTFLNACKAPKAGHVLGDGSGIPVALTDLEPALLASGFQFYGRPIHRIWVSKNGYLSFAQDNPEPDGEIRPGPLDRDITHMGVPPPALSVMAFWDNLYLRPEGVCYALDGGPRNQQLRVTWAGACLTPPCGSDNLNFTITLDETTKQVGLTYGTMAAGNDDRAHGLTATVGLVNDATGCPSEACDLATGLCKDGSTPCGYSQVFSNTRSDLQSTQFTPIVDPE